jgi:hypothetical protein
MEKRFGQLRATQAEGWRGAFTAQWRELLSAELELRLEAVTGMVEALNNESKYQE